MGTEITLNISGLCINYGKNDYYDNHASLFVGKDKKDIPYAFYEINEDRSISDEKKIKYDYGMSKSILDAIQRVEMLGYSLVSFKRYFEYLISRFDDDIKKLLTFDKFMDIFKKLDHQEFLNLKQTDKPLENFSKDVLFKLLDINVDDEELWHVKYEFARLIENIHPYYLIRLFAENENASLLTLDWEIAPHNESGWSSIEEFMRAPIPSERFLIVTEGSSDAKIIKRAFHILRPQIEDFFDYVDMEEGYPFSGSGNLFRFAQGLISISIQNKVIFIFDNDAEGVIGFNKCSSLKHKENTRVIKLPDLDEFRHFKTIGPNGIHYTDINNRAASIECYLDIGIDAYVRWSEYKQDVDLYQGALVRKTSYTKKFLRQKGIVKNYDYKKMKLLLDMIVNSCIRIAESIVNEQ